MKLITALVLLQTIPLWQDLQLSTVSLKAVMTESQSPILAAFAKEIVAFQFN
tara:strand:+ start:2512 stop:2667 length:156 start_codon:yes stop_codon:yes gene_type:complete